MASCAILAHDEKIIRLLEYLTYLLHERLVL
jgi:hypothetical protein